MGRCGAFLWHELKMENARPCSEVWVGDPLEGSDLCPRLNPVKHSRACLLFGRQVTISRPGEVYQVTASVSRKQHYSQHSRTFTALSFLGTLKEKDSKVR